MALSRSNSFDSLDSASTANSGGTFLSHSSFGARESVGQGELRDGENYDAVWVRDEEVDNCMACVQPFSWSRRRHHCRQCGDVVCGPCSAARLPVKGLTGLQRVCDECLKLRAAQGEPVTVENALALQVDADEAIERMQARRRGSRGSLEDAGAAAVAPSLRAPSPSHVEVDYRKLMLIFYAKHESSKLLQVDRLLRKYKGQEAAMVRGIVRKYGSTEDEFYRRAGGTADADPPLREHPEEEEEEPSSPFEDGEEGEEVEVEEVEVEEEEPQEEAERPTRGLAAESQEADPSAFEPVVPAAASVAAVAAAASAETRGRASPKDVRAAKMAAIKKQKQKKAAVHVSPCGAPCCVVA